MEEKRSCHSLHSVRSQRSFLSRPASEAEDDRNKSGKLVNNLGGVTTNGHYAHARASSGHGKSVVDTNQNLGSNYLKVEGGAYRVQRSSSSGSGNISAQSQTTDSSVVLAASGKVLRSCDASTQSCASSSTQTDESCLAPLVSSHLHPSSHSPLPPSAHGPMVMDPSASTGDLLNRSGSVLGMGPYTRATSPTPPYAFGQPVPTSCYHSYDPNTAYYHTYLNPMVDTGYQYDIVVRRPSVGPQSELSVPGGDTSVRRPSVGNYPSPHPGHLLHHHLSPHSLPGSFDSSLPPPIVPSFSASPGGPPGPPHGPPGPPSVSPHHHLTSTSPIAINSSDHGPGPNQTIDQVQTKPVPAPATTTTDIPKLIHETSI